MRNFLFVLFLLAGTALNAQESENIKGFIGINFSTFGENDVFRFNELDGAAGNSGENFFAIGVNYIYPIKKWLNIESGLVFSKHKISVSPLYTGLIDVAPQIEKIILFDIPVTLHINFLKYFFFHTGINLDIDGNISNSIDNQSGIGANTGLGLKYDFDFGGSIFINPYLKYYSLIPFSADDYHQRVMESGVRFGVMYKIGKGTN